MDIVSLAWAGARIEVGDVDEDGEEDFPYATEEIDMLALP